jgi:hypothetical protein
VLRKQGARCAAPPSDSIKQAAPTIPSVYSGMSTTLFFKQPRHSALRQGSQSACQGSRETEDITSRVRINRNEEIPARKSNQQIPATSSWRIRGSFLIAAAAPLPTSQRSFLKRRRIWTGSVATLICVSLVSRPATRNGATKERSFLSNHYPILTAGNGAATCVIPTATSSR